MEAFPLHQRVEIVNRLFQLTSDDRLEWQPVDEYEFVAEGSALTYALVSRDRDDFHPYIVTVRDGSGKVLVDFESDSSAAADAQRLNTLLHDLYRIAKNKALNLDRIADDIFRDLDSL